MRADSLLAYRCCTGRVRGLHFALVSLFFVLLGYVYSFGFADFGWLLALCVLVCLFWALFLYRGESAWRMWWYGCVFGFVFYFSYINWVSFLGLWAPVGLAAVMSLWWGVYFVLVAFVCRMFGRNIYASAIVCASFFVLIELLYSSFPFGGFGWSRLAFSQADGPFLHSVAVWGFAGLAFVLVLCVALFAFGFASRSLGSVCFFAPFVAVGAVCLVVLSVISAIGMQAPGVRKTGQMIKILGVQSNTMQASYFVHSIPGEVFFKYVELTHSAFDLAKRAGGVDLILWPEGSVDLSLQGRQVATELDAIVRKFGVPVIANGVMSESALGGEVLRNTQFVWGDKNGSSTVGNFVHKNHLVPFGEFVPLRGIFEAVFPQFLDIFGREYAPGPYGQHMRVESPGSERSRELSLGVAICYDIVDDRGMQLAAMGSDFIIAPTNNADFGISDQPRQQAIIARMRAVELGTNLVQVSTTAYSAVWDYLGRELAVTTPFTPEVFVAKIPLTKGSSIAAIAGRGIASFFASFGVAVCLYCVFARMRMHYMRKNFTSEYNRYGR